MQTPLSYDTAYRPPGYSADRWHSANVIPPVVVVVSTIPPVTDGSVQATPTNAAANRDRPPMRVHRMGSFLGIMSALSARPVVLLSGGTSRPEPRTRHLDPVG